jgi:hypothetical protein
MSRGIRLLSAAVALAALLAGSGPASACTPQAWSVDFLASYRFGPGDSAASVQ